MTKKPKSPKRGPGRPKAIDGRTTRLIVRLTPGELEAIKQSANCLDSQVSSYVRRKLLGHD